MNPCDRLEAWLDGRVDGAEARSVEAHLSQCPRCAEARAQRARLDSALSAWAGVRRAPSTDPFASARLIAEARRRATAPPVRWRLVLGTVALCSLAVGAFGAHLMHEVRPRPGHVMPLVARPSMGGNIASGSATAAPAVDVLFAEGVVRTPPGEIEVADGGRAVFRVGGDVFGVGAASAARIDPPSDGADRISLLRGSIAVAAAHREPGRGLVVRSGGVDVVVIGTRFLVERLPDGSTKVGVDEGLVEVRSGRLSERVGAAQELVVDAAGAVRRSPTEVGVAALLHPAPWLPAPSAAPSVPVADAGGAAVNQGAEVAAPIATAPAPAPTLASIRRALAEGAPAGASAIVQWTAEHPGDAHAWSLRARVEDRAGQVDAAIASWRRAVALSPDSERLRFEYELARRLADRTESRDEALALYSAVLGGGAGPLEADVRLRLGRLLLDVGRDAEGREVLESLMARHPAAPESQSARALLAKP